MRAEPLVVAADTVAIALAYGLALLLRFDGVVPAYQARGFVVLLPVAIVAHLAWQAHRGCYGRVWRQAGVAEARDVVIATAGASVTTVTVTALFPTLTVARSVPLMGGAFTLLLVGALRFRHRLVGRPAACPDSDAPRVVLIGPVEIARPVIEQLRAEASPDLVPVAVVSTNPGHWGREVAGVPVHGPLSALASVARERGADEVLLTLPSDDPGEVRRAADVARAAGLRARILPSVHDVITTPAALRDIRDLSIDDVLGRRQVETDMAAIAKLLVGRRVLITGGGGSIGAEIARQVASFAPRRLVLLDHDETHLHDAMALIDDVPGPAGAEPTTVAVLGDIRDGPALDRTFARERPDVVFHAAALKHVPILERFPSQAVTANVLGTDNVLQAAAAHHVERVVLISTDKAVEPSNVMGATKRIGEQLLLHRRPAGARHCAVRFGNVLGSRGSVIPTFLRQIERGGPVTVTHPEMTRYFMSIREAVQLVLQAAVLTEGGEIFLLDMGQPVRIVELAERLIFLAGGAPGRDIDITFTGVRPGEKLHEHLTTSREREHPTAHPKVRRVDSVPLAATELEEGLRALAQAAAVDDVVAVRDWLQRLTQEPTDPRIIDLTSAALADVGVTRKEVGA